MTRLRGYNRYRHSTGFTLVELIMVIVVLGIVGIATSAYINQGVTIYSQSAKYQQMVNQGRFVLSRLQRELRASLPNSVRYAEDATDSESTNCIEFLPVVASSSYIDVPFYPASSSDTLTLVTPNFDTDDRYYEFAEGDKLAIYVLSSADAWENECDAVSGSVSDISICELESFTDYDSTETPATAASATFAVSQRYALESPSQRYYITRGETRYCVDGDALVRSDDGGDNWVTMTEGLYYASGEQPFIISDASLTRNGLVEVLFPFKDDDDIIEFSHDIHIPNQP